MRDIPYLRLADAAAVLGVPPRDLLDRHRWRQLLLCVWLEAGEYDQTAVMEPAFGPNNGEAFKWEDVPQAAPLKYPRGLYAVFTHALDPLLQGGDSVVLPYVMVIDSDPTRALRLVKPVRVTLEGLLAPRTEVERLRAILGPRGEPLEEEVAIPGPKPFDRASKPDDPRPQFERGGEVWTISFGGSESKQYTHLDGFLYIRKLVQNATKPISAVSLHRLSRKVDEDPPEEAVTILDPREELRVHDARLNAETVKSYRTEIKRLNRRIQDAQPASKQTDRLRAEVEALQSEIAKLTDVHGKARPSPRSPIEKARKAVGNAIVRAIKRLEASLPELAQHLAAYIAEPRSANPVYRAPASPEVPGDDG